MLSVNKTFKNNLQSYLAYLPSYHGTCIFKSSRIDKIVSREIICVAHVEKKRIFFQIYIYMYSYTISITKATFI